MDDAAIRAADHDHRRQSHGSRRACGGDRRYRPVQEPAEAGELFRAEPARAPVGARRRPSRPHQQGRPQPCPRHAGRGGLGGGQGARAAARLLRTHPGQAGSSDRRRRRCPQAHGAVLAYADQGDGLSLGAAGTGRQQDARHGTAGRAAAEEGQQARSGLRLQRQGAARPGDARRSSRPSKPTSTSSRTGSRGRPRDRRVDASSRQGSNKAARRSLQPTLRSSPRGHPRTAEYITPPAKTACPSHSWCR